MLGLLVALTSSLLLQGSTAQVIKDSGVAGPPLELEHLFYDEWPTGIAVSSTGRKFANYPGKMDHSSRTLLGLTLARRS